MKEIVSSYVLEGSQDEILAHLSPTRIAEYMGYTVRETEAADSGRRLRVRKYDTEFTLAVRETVDGYQFSQSGSEGPFRILEGDLYIRDADAVEGTRASRVTVEITYTIGSFFSFLLDWLARRIVKRDADALLENLAREMTEEREGSGPDATEGEVSTEAGSDATEGNQADASGDRQDPDAERQAVDGSSATVEGNRNE